MPRPTFQNDYAADGKDLRAQTRADAGHRCVRCGHPYQTGLKRADRGEWSDCDERCTHGGEIRFGDYGAGPPYYPADWGYFYSQNKISPATMMAAPNEARKPIIVQAKWRILTVHHFDGDKANDRWWNHLPLCQKCHLQFQNKVDPNVPFFFEHSPWLKPYVAGFYAKKYEGKDLTREAVDARLDELLAWECRVPNDSRATRLLAADDRSGARQLEEGPAPGADGLPDRPLPGPDLGNP